MAEKIDGAWVTHQWLKKAVLLYFRAHDNRVIDGGATTWFDKVPMRFAGYTDAQFRQEASASCRRRRRAPAPSSGATSC